MCNFMKCNSDVVLCGKLQNLAGTKVGISSYRPTRRQIIFIDTKIWSRIRYGIHMHNNYMQVYRSSSCSISQAAAKAIVLEVGLQGLTSKADTYRTKSASGIPTPSPGPVWKQPLRGPPKHSVHCYIERWVHRLAIYSSKLYIGSLKEIILRTYM